MNELQLFRQGHDTLQIAKRTKQTEAEVCRKMHSDMEAEYQYRQEERWRSKPAPKAGLRPYAGHDPRCHDEWERV